jgi:hypothetical protein
MIEMAYPPMSPPPPGASPPWAPAQLTTSGTALASMIIGIANLACLFMLLIPQVVGLVLGILGLQQIQRGERGGRGFAITGIALNAVWLVIGLIVVASWIASPEEDETEEPAAEAAQEDEEEEAEDEAEAEEEEEEAEEEEPPVLIEAEATEFTPSILYNGGDFTSVQVTITNNGEENLDVNPLSFSIVDDEGTKHDTWDGLGEDEHEIDLVTLSPGQNAEGTVTAAGDFVPESVEFEEDVFFDTTYSAPVE